MRLGSAGPRSQHDVEGAAISRPAGVGLDTSLEGIVSDACRHGPSGCTYRLEIDLRGQFRAIQPNGSRRLTVMGLSVELQTQRKVTSASSLRRGIRHAWQSRIVGGDVPNVILVQAIHEDVHQVDIRRSASATLLQEAQL